MERFDKCVPVKLTVPPVDFRNLILEFLKVAFGETPHDSDVSDASFLLCLDQFEDKVYGFLFRIADKPSGIHNDPFATGLLGVMGGMITFCFQPSQKPLGVYKILRASHRNHVDAPFLRSDGLFRCHHII